MMNAERFTQLIDSYGADEARWPDEQRAEMLVFLDAHREGRQLLQEARAVDLALDSYRPATIDLSERIMAALPRSVVDRLVEWLLPSVPTQWWRPAVAGAMPLILGLAIGIGPMNVVSDEDFDWEMQEQALMTAPAGDWYE